MEDATKKFLSGSEMVELVAKLLSEKGTQKNKDCARQIIHAIEGELRQWLFCGEIPVWLVWQSRYEGEMQLNQLRAIDTDISIAEKHKKMLEAENETLGRKSHISIKGTTLNHLFAWTMLQKLKKEVRI